MNTSQRGLLTFPSGKEIRIEVVSGSIEVARGLSGRQEIDDSYGMLFLFDEPNIARFWMKEMNFSIDMIWIDDDVILGIEKNVPVGLPGEKLKIYSPDQLITRVLEVKAGFADRFDVNVRDTLDIQFPKE